VELDAKVQEDNLFEDDSDEEEGAPQGGGQHQ
jgi:hypothetical protein